MPQDLTNMGMIGIKSTHGRYLQAHSDNGEMHASNQNRNTEETWFLYQVDKAQKQYALMNWSNGWFMSHKAGTQCAPANAQVLTNSEIWILVDGAPLGALNAVAFKSLSDGAYLGAYGPGQDTPCGGEVGCGDPSAPQARGDWPGWWVMEPASAPAQGRDVWNTVAGAITAFGSQIINKLSPADIAAVLTALA